MTDPTPIPTQRDKANFLLRFAYQSAILGWLFSLTCGGLLTKGCTAPAPAPLPSADISLPSSAQGDVGRAIPIDAETKGSEVQWWCEDSADLIVRHSGGSKSAAFVAPKPGTYTVLAWTSLKGHPTEAAVCKVTVGTPTPPIPPVPPKPPDPPSPIPGDGFRVLVVFDPDLSKLSPAQVAVLTSSKVRQYLDAKCVKGADGKSPEYRFWPASIDASKESKLWQDALKLPRSALPWIVIADGDKGTSQALPATPDETLKLLQRFGG